VQDFHGRVFYFVKPCFDVILHKNKKNRHIFAKNSL
jgi:hypothetical protein